MPKTIDNDVVGTIATFGFDTAVSTATDAIDKLHSTAESHERVMVVELMGRHAGFIALNSGVSATADVILIPEIPFEIEKVLREDPEARRGRPPLQHRGRSGGRQAQGWRARAARAAFGWNRRPPGRYRVRWWPEPISERTGKETRTLVLGHMQRGGSPTTFDRLLGLRFGAAAVRAVADRAFGTMIGSLHASHRAGTAR